MQHKKTIINLSEENTTKLALLIDADNASSKDIENILSEATIQFGEITVKRIYGNFTAPNAASWKDCLNKLAIKPMQQFAYTTGKNATDGFMIIDAMDLLYTNRFDGFCLVSSDSDFTALAIRIREQGLAVYGFGKKQTPTAFINACTQFIHVENLRKEESSLETTENNKNITNESTTTSPNPSSTTLPIEKIKQIFDNAENDWIPVSLLGQQWKLLQTDFDTRTYGYKKLTDLVRAHTNIFQIEERQSSEDNPHKNLYVKLKTNP